MGLTLCEGGEEGDRGGGGGRKVLLWLAVLPAETGRAARSTVVNGRPATKGKRRVKSSGKWRRIQCFCPTPTLPPHCWACRLWRGRGGEEGSEWGRQRVPVSPLHFAHTHTHTIIHTPTHKHTHIHLTAWNSWEQDRATIRETTQTENVLLFSHGWEGGRAYLCA